MKNPFMYGKPVSGEYYLPMPNKEKELLQFVESGIGVVIIGPRRFGKTSFLSSFLENRKADGWHVVNVDAFNVTSHRDFLVQLAIAINSEQSIVASVLSWLRNKALANTVLKIDVDAITGQSNLSLSFNENDATESKKAILNALNAVAALGRKVILSIDEFQKVAEIDDSGWLEATLRTSMQKSKNISHIFTGSRRGLLEDMFNNKKRPFYRSCNIMQFEQTPAGFSEWIVTRFARAAIKCAVDVADYIRTRVNNTPSYVQEVCFHLVSQGCITIDKRAVDSTLDAIAAQSSYSYEALLNSMTPVQIRALKMLVNEGRFSYSKDRLNRYEFKSASNIQGAIKSLCDKQILDRKPGGTSQEFEFDDPMFRIWLMKIYNA